MGGALDMVWNYMKQTGLVSLLASTSFCLTPRGSTCYPYKGNDSVPCSYECEEAQVTSTDVGPRGAKAS